MTPRRSKYGARHQPERAEHTAVVKLLRSIGAKVYVLGTVRRRGDYHGTMQTPGLPDLWAWIPRHDMVLWDYVWIEVKAVGGRLSAEQQHFQAFCREAGCKYLVGGVDVVLAYLRQRGLVK